MKVYLDGKLKEKDAKEVIVIKPDKELIFKDSESKAMYLTSSQIVGFTVNN